MGIGIAYAEAMADNGAQVVLLDRDRDALDRAGAQLSARGARVDTQAVDVTDHAALDRALADTALRSGRLDVVFANAGITAGPGFLTVDGKRDPAGAIENIPFDLWQRVIATNLSAVFATLPRRALPLKRQNGGCLIATTSVAGLRPSAVVGTPYMIAKAACAHLVRQAALESRRSASG